MSQIIFLAAANQAINNPTAKVRFILGGQDADLDDQPHDVFTELEEYCCDENGVEEWKETARWLKFEEDVEEGGDRWSKPHVATLSLYSVFELRSCIVNGTVLLDMHARNLIQITGGFVYYNILYVLGGGGEGLIDLKLSDIHNC